MIPSEIHIASDTKLWQVLSVGACSSLHKATELALDKLSFVGRGFDFSSAYTLSEAKVFLQNQPNLSIVLLDMVKVKKEPNFGKELIHYIRKELQNDMVRLILVTGYPHSVPEKEITNNYVIDACISKEEFSNELVEFTFLSVIQTYHQLQTVTEYMQGLAGSIAHELRTPLTIFNSNFIAIKNTISEYEGKLSEEDYEVLNSSIQMGSRICERTNQIIDITLKNIRNQKFDTKNFHNYSIAETIHNALNHYVYSKVTHRDKIRTDFEEDFQFHGDETLLIFVIYNLLKNALYYVANDSNGKIEMKLEQGIDKNVLYFSNNGPGIPPSNLPHIFDQFMTAGKEDGTGLGLVFCKRVMHAFGGDIQCDSLEGKGVTFTLSFPRV